jgi:hypothetical protein
MNFGHPGGDYHTNRAAIDAWLKSPEHNEYTKAFNAWDEERNRFVNSMAFKAAIECMKAKHAARAKAA